MKKVAVRAMIILAAVVALSLFFSGTIRTLTTPKVRFLTPRQGKFEQITELTGSVYFPSAEDLTLDLPEGTTLTLNSVKVQAGDEVKKGDPLFSATIVDFSKNMANLEDEYNTARSSLRNQERKNGEIRLTRNEQAWRTAYYAASDADAAKRDRRVDLLALLEEEGLELTADGKLPENASEKAQEAWNSYTDAVSASEAADRQLNMLSRYAIAESVWEDLNTRQEQQDKMKDAEEQMTQLTVLSRLVSAYPAPHKGFISAVSVEKGAALDASTVLMKITPEDAVPVIRADISDIKQTVSKGAAVEVEQDRWTTYSTKVAAVGVNADNTRYADITITEDLIRSYTTIRNLAKNDLKLRLTSRAQESTCLIPATAVRGSEGDRYVYVAVRQSSTFGGTQTIVQKTPVTVLNESDTVVSVAEDLTYSQIIYQEDRALNEGDSVMAYENEE